MPILVDTVQNQEVHHSGHEIPVERQKILIVDDDPDITLSFKIGLEQYGFLVDTFNNPLLAIGNYKKGLYGLLLLDVRMPIMDGFELYKEIRKMDPDVKVCFITAYEISNEDFKKSFPEMILKHFIKKPIAIDELAKELNRKLKDNFDIIS